TPDGPGDASNLQQTFGGQMPAGDWRLEVLRAFQSWVGADRCSAVRTELPNEWTNGQTAGEIRGKASEGLHKKVDSDHFSRLNRPRQKSQTGEATPWRRCQATARPRPFHSLPSSLFHRTKPVEIAPVGRHAWCYGDAAFGGTRQTSQDWPFP